MGLSDIARRIKDDALALSFKALFNDRFGDFGHATKCQVDTRRSRISLTAVLHGEQEPVTAILERYELVTVDGDRYIVLHRLSSSRLWIDKLLTQTLANKRYKLPAAINRLL